MIALSPGTLERAKSHAAAREFGAAIACLEDAIKQDRQSAQVWDLLARALSQSGRPAEALAAAHTAAELEPRAAARQHLLGSLYKALGDFDNAIIHYGNAVALNPDNPALYVSAGVALRGGGRLADSIDTYWQALQIDPFLREARLHLGNALAQMQREPQDMERILRPAADAERAVGPILQSAQSALQAGQPLEALRALAYAGRLWPYSAETHGRLGSILWDQGSPEEALVHWDLAARFRPDWADAWEQAGALAASLGLPERSAVYLGELQKIRPSDALTVTMALSLPAIAESSAGIAVTRQRYADALDRLLATPLRLPDPFRTTQLTSFYLAYHGLGNKELHVKLAQVLLQAAPGLDWTAPHVRERRSPNTRVKVGFVSHFMHSHSIGKTTQGLVAQLSREQFEVYVIDLPPVPDDEVARHIRGSADHHVTVDQSLEAARGQIAALELDILFYQDIGMESFGYYLAFSRLAPVQCVSYGHPDTTGIPNIDYFISNDLYELAQGAQHYSERLFLLRDLPTLAYYYRPQIDQRVIDRARFGMSDAEHIYLCPQTLFKIHPQFDDLLAGILRRDPRGRVILIRSHCEQWRTRLVERFKRTAPDIVRRISFIPELPFGEFMQLLAAADVILDTIHFNGMNSSLEAFAAGAPVVTLPGSLQRGRHTQAMYRKMEIPDCVAADENAYIDIAVRLGTDPAYRRQLSRTILERNTVLYRNDAVTREFERFFTTAVRGSGR